jgi:hypothetical protein
MRTSRSFIWNNPEHAKREFPEFYDEVRKALGARAWTLSKKQTEAYEPVALGPRPDMKAKAAAVRIYETKEIKYKESVQKLGEAFFYALSVIRALLPFGSKARIDFDMAADTDPGDGSDWGPQEQFRAGIQALTSKYSATTIADVDSLKRDLFALTDERGFHPMVAEFNRLVLAIRSAGREKITDQELRVCVENAIRNPTVAANFALKYYLDNENATYQDIFTDVGKYLQKAEMIGLDPYQTVNGGRGSVGANVTRITPSNQKSDASYFKGCIRCWSVGHNWRDCRADKCGYCHSRIPEGEKTTCPQWKSHPAPFRFVGDVLPWNRPRFGSHGEPGDRSSAPTQSNFSGQKRKFREKSSGGKFLAIENGQAGDTQANSAVRKFKNNRGRGKKETQIESSGSA